MCARALAACVESRAAFRTFSTIYATSVASDGLQLVSTNRGWYSSLPVSMRVSRSGAGRELEEEAQLLQSLASARVLVPERPHHRELCEDFRGRVAAKFQLD